MRANASTIANGAEDHQESKAILSGSVDIAHGDCGRRMRAQSGHRKRYSTSTSRLLFVTQNLLIFWNEVEVLRNIIYVRQNAYHQSR